MEINNRRYLGNKYKLLSFIRRVVDEECKDVSSVFDVFSGTGAVASAFLDKTLILNDILYSNHMAHVTWFSSETINREKLETIIDEYNCIDNVDEDNYMTKNFSNTYFSKTVCSKIGYIRDDIEAKANVGILNSRERAILITSLLYAIDKIARTVGHYDAYRKTGELPDGFSMSFPQLFENISEGNRCYQLDSNELAKTVYADLAYLDPPYNSRQYSDAYHLLENIAEWKKPDVYGVARKMDRSAIKSDYCTNKATKAFEELINSLQCKYILLSYNNTGNNANERSNARISDEDIIRILSQKGKVKIFEQNYKAFTTGKSDNSNNKERLFLCVVNNKKSDMVRSEYIASPLNYTGGKFRLLPQIMPLFPSKIDTFVDLFCGGCNVGINVDAKTHIYNDNNGKLVGLIAAMKATPYEKWRNDVLGIIDEYGLTKSFINGYTYYGCESNKGLSDYNKVPYLKLRAAFNNYLNRDVYYYELLYTLIVFSFNNQVRFNSSSKFNLPVGKRDFNSKMQDKLEVFMDALQKQHTIIQNSDFRNINAKNLPNDSFIYVDPPYLITTASYNENGGWTANDENDLLHFLDELDKHAFKFALSNVLIHKGKTNDILAHWVNHNKYKIHHLSTNYSNSNYHTNRVKDSDEVLITNY